MPKTQDRSGSEEAVSREPSAPGRRVSADAATKQAPLEIALLTGGQDRHYAIGLAMALMEQDVAIEVIGSDEIDGPELHENPHAQFRNLHGGQQSAGLAQRIGRILAFYARLFRYAATARPKIFHILWNNKLQALDRTFVMLFYKLAGKKVVFTAHNVNAGRRDEKDTWLNRITLKCQYKLLDHLFVHTEKMKSELVSEFGVDSAKITIIPYGINNAVPCTELTREDAREMLGLRNGEKTILFFGAIKQYKGLEYLVAAFQQIFARGDYRLIVAGERKKGYEKYWQSIQETIERHPGRDKVLQKVEFIPDAETEIYFKAADVAVLPYTEIFQSGILFLAYSFGLPVISTDVGSFGEDILEGKTGFVCKARDQDDLARTIEQYFESDLYRELDYRRLEIRDYTLSRHSWATVAAMTRDVYSELLYRV